jgi:phosphoribosyl 1,2-cyclic phosphodiesterase
MKVSFWGVRGSFPVSTPEHTRYGGNTPCVEVASDTESVLIDAGTGIRLAGKSMVERGQKRIALLLSHTHWDHIQGLPHFEPLHCPDTKISIHSIRRDNRSLHDIVFEQQRSPFFPISLDDVQAELTFIEHDDGESFDIGDIRVLCKRLNHPGIAAGYRLECDGSVFAYICDTDLYGEKLQYADELSDTATAEERLACLEELRQGARDLGHSADLIVCDTFFLPDEFEPEWGHSTPDDAIRLATEAQAKRVGLFHHRPGRKDDQLDALVERYRKRTNGSLEILACREGLHLTL